MCEAKHQWHNALVVAAYLKAKAEGQTLDEVIAIYNLEITRIMDLMDAEELCYPRGRRCPAALPAASLAGGMSEQD